MSEFRKNVLSMLLTAVIGAGVSSFATISGISTDIANTNKSLDRIYIKLDKYDDRLRKAELVQAQYIAAN